MPQVSIQFDPGTFKVLEMLAAKRHTSISKWIKESIQKEIKQEWPESYFSLFGILGEDDLAEPPEIPFNYDSQREEL